MRRHALLALSSAIVIVGGAGPLADGAPGLRAAAIGGYFRSIPSAPAVRHARRASPAAAAARPGNLLLPGRVPATPLPYLLATRPLPLGRAVASRRISLSSEGAVTDTQWRALRNCESDDHYDIDTGNGYYAAYQFAPTTWWALGYRSLPRNAPAAVQDRAARRLQHIVGWSAWPVCSAVLRL